MTSHSLLGQFLVLGAGTAVVCVRIYRYAATGYKETGHLYVLGIHQFDKVLHDAVHAVLVESAVIAVTVQIEFERLALRRGTEC